MAGMRRRGGVALLVGRNRFNGLDRPRSRSRSSRRRDNRIGGRCRKAPWRRTTRSLHRRSKTS